MSDSNPVHYWDGKWWFWAETWAERIGPYESEQRAIKRCKDYAHFLEFGEDPEQEEKRKQVNK